MLRLVLQDFRSSVDSFQIARLRLSSGTFPEAVAEYLLDQS
ncbi:MAG: hypothetical protein ACLQOO_12690 [Terriglobia bacterium]